MLHATQTIKCTTRRFCVDRKTRMEDSELTKQYVIVEFTFNMHLKCTMQILWTCIPFSFFSGLIGGFVSFSIVCASCTSIFSIVEIYSLVCMSSCIHLVLKWRCTHVLIIAARARSSSWKKSGQNVSQNPPLSPQAKVDNVWNWIQRPLILMHILWWLK